jgi:hypothetical protein
MSMLALAVEIARVVETADQKQCPLEAEAVADRLDEAHPEAEANREQILEALVEEGAAAGIAIEPEASLSISRSRLHVCKVANS